MDTKKLRQKILDLAIRGKLVPQDSNDEPASVLLERIKAEKEQLIKEGKIKRSKQSASSDTFPYENVPFEIPESWAWTTVGDISLSILYGVSESAKSAGKYRLLRITDIQNNRVNWDTVPYSDFEDNAQNYILEDGDILFARTGATVGKSYLVNDIPVSSIYASYLIRVKSTKSVLPEYVKLFFESGFYWEQISMTAVGVGQPNVNGTSLANLRIPLPPYNEQTRIVKESSNWLKRIDTLDNDMSELEDSVGRIKSKILDLAIHGKLVPQDPNDEPAIELLRRINPDFQPCDNAHYIMLPDGWSWCLLEDVANVLDSKRQPIKTEERKKRIQGKSITYPYYGATGIAGDIDDYIMEGRYILLGEDGAPFLDKNAPKAYEVTGRFWVNNHAHILEPQIAFLFLLHFLNAVDYAGYVKGTTRLKLTQSDMNRIKIMLPPLSEQQRIVAKIEELFATLDKIKESLEV